MFTAESQQQQMGCGSYLLDHAVYIGILLPRLLSFQVSLQISEPICALSTSLF